MSLTMSAGGCGGNSANSGTQSSYHFFVGNDGTNGWELWKSNGTAAGTTMVKDISTNPTSVYSYPVPITDVNGIHYFIGDDGVNGKELWRSDGSSAGTSMTKAIDPDPSGAGPQTLSHLDSTVFFSIADKVGGTPELWITDGTETGTVKLLDNNGEALLSPNNYVQMGGFLYFMATDAANGAELWKSDGTPAGTTLVKDINPGTAGSYPSSLIVANAKLYFIAADATYGIELWESDGTGGGTVRLTDINLNAGNGVDNGGGLIAVNGKVFFGGYDGTDVELWAYDLTNQVASQVKNINPSGASSPNHFMDLSGLLVFQANDGTHGQQFWTSDGTDAGTAMIKQIGTGLSLGGREYVVAGKEIYFRGNDGVTGAELWKTDGTAQGTMLVKDINPLPLPGGQSYPDFFAYVGGKVYFGATDGTHGYELWKTDGTEAGTVMIKDINPGSGDGHEAT